MGRNINNMANTYTKIYLQFVFAVENRMSLIQPTWKDELYKYITGILKNNNHKLLAINGVSNHIHIFINYKPHQLIPDLLQDIKGDSSRWINKNKLVRAILTGKQDMVHSPIHIHKSIRLQNI